MRACRRPALAAALLAAVAAPAAGVAQERTVTVVAGREYRAGSLQRFLLGREYRDLWTVPVRVPVLDLATFAGGLTPTEKGGGNQTVSVRFRGADGREYAFRSVNKEQGGGLHADLQGTVVQRVLQDQVSSLVPGAPVVADVLLNAAGVLHPHPRLAVMPDDPRLGEFRAEFAGMLGTIEERPDVGSTGDPVLARAAAMEGTDDFLEALDSGAEHRVDDRDYLAMRLMDLFLNDWDRHADQFRWARFDSGGVHLWRAVSRDRDYALVDYDGFLPDLARSRVPNAVRFRGDYRGSLRGLMVNAQQLDRRVLGELPRATYDSVAADLQARLSDAVIASALRRLPAEYQALQGERIAALLRQRRDALPDVAEEFYQELAREAEVHARAAPDRAAVERMDDGGVEVTLHAGGSAAPYFRRRFLPDETREVRLFLRAGDDLAQVRGTGPEEVRVRVVGGAGADELRDETRSGHRTAFYDGEGPSRFTARPRTKIDLRPYEEPEFVRGGGRRPPRDGGVSASLASPAFGWKRNAGPYLGIGPSRTRYGFRRSPYASAQSLTFLWAPLDTRFGAEYRGDFRYVNSADRLTVLARASELEAVRFHGFGNATPDATLAEARVWERQLRFEPEYLFSLTGTAALSLAGLLRWTDPQPEPGGPADVTAPRGARSFGMAGARVGVHLDGRGEGAYPREGYALNATAAGYPVAVEDAEPFGEVRGVGTAYLSLGAGPTLALRAGGARVWGGFPLQHAAFVGGERSLRGYAGDRFAGDASAHGSAELRQLLGRVKLVIHGELGVFALADAARVWFDGDSPDGWHTALGGGLLFTTLGRAQTATLTFAHGESWRMYAGLGIPF